MAFDGMHPDDSEPGIPQIPGLTVASIEVEIAGSSQKFRLTSREYEELVASYPAAEAEALKQLEEKFASDTYKGNINQMLLDIAIDYSRRTFPNPVATIRAILPVQRFFLDYSRNFHEFMFSSDILGAVRDSSKKTYVILRLPASSSSQVPPNVAD